MKKIFKNKLWISVGCILLCAIGLFLGIKGREDRLSDKQIMALREQYPVASTASYGLGHIIPRTMDPDAKSWERTVNNVTDYYSRHRFSDKSMVYVYYTIDKETQQPIVESFRDADTQDSVLTYLIPKDLELLTKE